MKNRGILKAGKVLSKIVEVISWIGMVMLFLMAVLFLFAPEQMRRDLLPQGGLSIHGTEMAIDAAAASLPVASMVILLLGGALGFGVTAWLFRLMHQVLKTAETAPPVHPENVRRIERIGWLAIAMPVLGLVISLVAQLFCPGYVFEINIDLTGIVMGVLVLCLSQFFAQGAALQNDVDGLV